MEHNQELPDIEISETDYTDILEATIGSYKNVNKEYARKVGIPNYEQHIESIRKSKKRG